MKVLFTTQVFTPETHPSALMIHQLAHHLIADGHQVSVAAGFPHHPRGRLFDGYHRRPILRETLCAVQVTRVWHFVSPGPRVATRAAVMASQSLAIALAGALSAPPDIVVSYGPPLGGPLLSALVARRFAAPLLSVIYDLYPDAAIRAGSLRVPVLTQLARVMERAAYRLSDHLLVPADGFRRSLLGRGVPASKISVVPVWLDANEIRPLPRDNAWRREQGIGPDKRVVLYAGTIGLVSGAGMVLDVAERLSSRSDVLILFVGGGQLEAELQANARERRLLNVRFLPFQPRERVAEVQAASDVSVVTLAPGGGYSSVPSKVIGYMAAARPVVASVDFDSDTAECVRRAGCGTVVRPGDSESMATALCHLLDDPCRSSAAAANARKAFERAYSAQVVLSRYTQLLESLADHTGA